MPHPTHANTRTSFEADSAPVRSHLARSVTIDRPRRVAFNPTVLCEMHTFEKSGSLGHAHPYSNLILPILPSTFARAEHIIIRTEGYYYASPGCSFPRFSARCLHHLNRKHPRHPAGIRASATGKRSLR